MNWTLGSREAESEEVNGVAHAQLNGFNMYYEIHGEGEPVVCSTGWGLLTGARFQSIPAELRERYQLIVYDHRGIGQSSDGSEHSGSTRLYAEDVAQLIMHLGLKRAHILGRGGLGACVMQELAISHPELVHSLALSGGWARPEPYHDAVDRLFYRLREQTSFELFQLYGAIICYDAEYFNENHADLLSPNGPWSELRECKEAHLKLIRACLEHDAYDRLPRISAPTLLIYGGVDLLAGPRLGRELGERIPGAELVILEGTPHVIASHPAAHARFGRVTGDFFARHSLSA
ncbi:MAG: alpha/beta hydrolase [Chloroflexi bacterium]|nr:alpha/beta hydrolase [Chloroflexota bacterium]